MQHTVDFRNLSRSKRTVRYEEDDDDAERSLLPTTTHKVGFWSVRGMWLPDLPPAQAPTLDLPGTLISHLKKQ